MAPKPKAPGTAPSSRPALGGSRPAGASAGAPKKKAAGAPAASPTPRKDPAGAKHVGSSVNITAGKGAKHKAFLDDNAKTTMSKEAKIEPSSTYMLLASEYEAKAVDIESHTKDNETLLSRFGAALSKKYSGKLDEKASIVLDWDKNGDGKLSLMEFRQQIRGVGVTEKDIHNVDDMFKEFDKDASGFLELSELKIAFKRAYVAHASVNADVDEIRDKAAVMRKIKEEAKEVGELTKELEAEEATLADLKDKKSMTVQEKLGLFFTKRNIHIGDMMKLDTSGDGLLDKKEFRVFIRKIDGLTGVEDGEIDGLFDSLDADGGGTLDIKELTEALKKLQAAAHEAIEHLTEQAELVSQMVKLVRKRQVRFAADKAAAELNAVEIQ